MIKGACLFGQSGGPTSVINASAYGIITEALRNESITKVYAMHHGIKGVLNDDLIEITSDDSEEIEKLLYTPGALFGSCRLRLKDYLVDDSEYRKILEIFKKYDIRYFLYIGGNDSMDTCNKVSKYMKHIGYDCNVIGIPKTIDNDLNITDHTPGFASCAKFINNSISSVEWDLVSYDQKSVLVFEIMGRNAGWLTASSALSKLNGMGPDLIYLPEVPFDINKFQENVYKLLEEKNVVMVAVSEGIKSASGAYLQDDAASGSVDQFGHTQLGGVGNCLVRKLKERNPKLKTRVIEFSLLQRCASFSGSMCDVEEAKNIGGFGLRQATLGETDKTVILKRLSHKPYTYILDLAPISEIANLEKTIPLNWIKEDGKGLTDEFIEYLLPLVEGEVPCKYKDGLIDYAKITNFKNFK